MIVLDHRWIDLNFYGCFLSLYQHLYC